MSRTISVPIQAAPPPPPMQNSPAINLPSLSSTHPINGTSESQRHDNEATGNTLENPAPLSPLRPPRSARRANANANGNNTTAIQRAAHLAKREIRTKLREDWSWPLTVGTLCSHQACNLPEEESAWQERGDGFDTDFESTAVDPYQYEDADAVVAPPLEGEEAQKWKRKREREEALREEMRWNEGLRCFVERRDAWAGARVQQQQQQQQQKTVSRSNFGERDRVLKQKRNAIYAPPIVTPTAVNGAVTPFTEETSMISGLLPSKPSPPLMLVPLAPPILPPANAVRASISPATYPAIYSKIVVQGLSPTVPINLHDVVGALVQGWKDNDEWPPKTEAEKAGVVDGVGEWGGVGMRDGGKRLARRGMGKMKKVFGLLGDGDEKEVGGNEGANVLSGLEGRYD